MSVGTYANRGNSAKILGWAAALTILSGFVFKSVLFVDGEPVIANYIVTSGAVALIGAFVFSTSSLPIDRSTGILAGLAIVWAVLSAAFSGISLNYLASVSFAVLLAGFGLVLPLALWRSRIEGWRLINALLSVGTILSLVLFVLAPDLAIDPDSDRLRGTYVSVAVACTLFHFNCFLAVREALVSRNRLMTVAWSGIGLMSFVCLYFTRTRSSLAELMIGLLALAFFAPVQRGMRIVMISVVGIGLIFSVIGLGAVSTGNISVDEQLAEFRLADRDLTDARDGNWEFGMERIAKRPLFGEGLLAKQTQGGTSAVDFSAKTSYDPRYDPHSLALSLAVQGGIPFFVLMTVLLFAIPVRFAMVFGLSRALQSPEFVLVSVRLLISLLSGGDMTALGNQVERLIWLLIGLMALKIELKRRQESGAISGAIIGRSKFSFQPQQRLPAPGHALS